MRAISKAVQHGSDGQPIALTQCNTSGGALPFRHHASHPGLLVVIWLSGLWSKVINMYK